MERVAEPEIMNGHAQVKAYAKADFSSPNQMFVNQFAENFPHLLTGNILDLGCGPADIPLRFARRYPQCHVLGVDGACRMLEFGQQNIVAQGMEERIKLVHGVLPRIDLPGNHFSAIISNSLLHHLDAPQVLWQTIKYCGRKDTAVLIMDLLRPASSNAARQIVEQYAAAEAEILQEDFYNSLLAAYTITEVTDQLALAGLNTLKVRQISDRHFIVAGSLPRDSLKLRSP